MEKKSKKTPSPNLQIYLYPEDADRLKRVILRENVIADKDGKSSVTKSGVVEKLVLDYLNRKEEKHSKMKIFME